jgi:sugar lactone lactonase YvrE
MTLENAASPRTLLSGLAVGESARWHAGRLWLANWGTQQVIAVDPYGKAEVMATVPTTVPFSIDWLPDGRLLAVSGREARLLVQEPAHTSEWATLADLRPLASGFNELVVDDRGNIYVNGSDYNFGQGGAYVPGIIALVTPDGGVRQVTDNIAFPNGMAVTPDNQTLIIAESYACQLTAFDIAPDGSLANRRVWAPTPEDHPDGICIDADGAVWYADVGNKRCVRVSEGGKVLNQIDLPDACFSCMLGGDDGRTLFMLIATWPGAEHMADLFQSKTGQVLAAPVEAPHAGYP